MARRLASSSGRAGHLDALRDCGMQPGQHVDDRGPVAVVDRVLEVTRRGVEVREQRQGMPAVQRADDLASPRRHRGDDELEPGFALRARPLSAWPPAGRAPTARPDR